MVRKAALFVGGMCALVVAPATWADRDTLLLRFAPRNDEPVSILFQTHTRFRAGERAKEFADVGGMTEIPLGVVNGAQALHLRYDSMRIRSREPPASWREWRPEMGDSGWMQVRVDDRLRVTGTSGRPHPGITDPVALITGVRDLELPERPVAAGDRWQTTASVRLPTGMHANDGAASPARLIANATAWLDSVRIRPYDTLGFVTVEGTFRRTTVTDPLQTERAAWSYTGDIIASLVWSTGWNAFVSGTNRSRIRARRREPTAPSDQTLEWEITTRYRVQP